MPSKKKLKDSKNLKQTTLFSPKSPIQTTASSSVQVGVTKVGPSSRSKKKKKLLSSSSSEAINSIQFAPTDMSNQVFVEEDSDSPILVTLQSKRKRKTRVCSSESEQEQSETKESSKDDLSEGTNGVAVSHRPHKHKRRVILRESSKSSEDLTHLAHEVDSDQILDTRLRTPVKSAFQMKLEILKRRKFKRPDEPKTEEDNDGKESEDAAPRTFRGARPFNMQDDEDSDSSFSRHSSDFIVEDGTGEKFQLPPEFSMETHRDISHQFKKIFQFFVHVAVQRPKQRAIFMEEQIEGEEYFSVPLQVTRRKLLGLRDSAMSSVWRPEFKKNLEKYPELEFGSLDFVVPFCDACHLGGRKSKIIGRLNGFPYNSLGFERQRSRKSEKVKKEFNFGRFCAARVEIYHKLSHWEYSLFKCIVLEIEELVGNSNGFEKSSFIGGRPPENLEDADALCEWLDERKMIDMEWHKLKQMMDKAQYLDHGGIDGETED